MSRIHAARRKKLEMDTCFVISCISVFCMLLQNHLLSSHAVRRQDTKELIQIGKNLKQIPQGGNSVHILNVAYNEIKELPDYVFFNNSYRNTKQMFLYQNNINKIGTDAFKGLRHLKLLDMSDNNITSLDPYVFKTNAKLHKLVLVGNSLRFDRLQTFLVLHALETLVLSKNKIEEIYDVTFLGVPNLKRLILSDNDLNLISRQSFKTLTKLHYLSLANTGVYHLGETMFGTSPRIINMENTPLAGKFEPPLRQVRDQSVKTLLQINNFVIDGVGNI